MDFESVRNYMKEFGDWLVDTGVPATGIVLGVIIFSPVLIPLLLGYTIYRFCYYLWTSFHDE